MSIEGIVQGVGFRPHVHRLARDLGLSGCARNVAGGLEVEVEGSERTVAEFVRRLQADAPPIAVIESLTVEELEPEGAGAFAIIPSRADAEGEIYVSPDVAICGDCRREMFDASDRRYRHPFINCTNCGPRFTIIEGVPYDRPRTSMARFEMCAECRREYEDIDDRRYHAQPVACPHCGPMLLFVSGACQKEGEDALAAARVLLVEGRILAVKGLGGFHLACDADNDAAVRRLRARKGREAKPLAVMAYDLPTARSFAQVGEDAATLMQGPEAPIVICDKREDAPLAGSVAPDSGSYGVMLPYTPLHLLLLEGLSVRALVMTSGNLSDEPLATDNAEAMERLGEIADGFLMHDRDIFIGCDDSVIRPTARGPVQLRRARGYVPFPVRLGVHTTRQRAGLTLRPPLRFGDEGQACRSRTWNGAGEVQAVTPSGTERVAARGACRRGRPGPEHPDARPCILAVGGHLKNTFCITRGRSAFISQHIGDLEDLTTLEYFERSVAHFESFLQVTPEGLACDLHPGFLSTRYAEQRAQQQGLPLERVQHHHAHLAAVLADNQLEGPAIGLICDGTGYGADTTVWGCEVLVGGVAQYERAGHLRQIRLAGSEAAVREPWRVAAAWLAEAFGPGFIDEVEIPFVQGIDHAAWATLSGMIARGVNAPLASSAGRLFDAVAALIGLCDRVQYEAQAPMKLEAIAQRGAKAYAFELCEEDEALILDPTPAIREIVADIERGEAPARIAGRFHATFVTMLAETAARMAERTGIDLVALSGGTFLNRIVVEDLMNELERRRLRPIMHRATPPGDGCVSLGQAAVAQARWQ
ncbi:MAG: carbamoyltransferase HypF [Armatimonadota bacterium]